MKRGEKRYIILLLLIQVAADYCFAQLPDYHVRMLPQKPGLVYPRQVEQLIKDDKGFLWFITPTMVQRFDGKNILSFSLDDRCINIQQDGDGTIFVATRQNIYRYKNDYSGFEILKEYTSSTPRYRALLAGPGKKIYLLTNDGILQWNRESGRMEATGIPAFKAGGSFPFLKSFGNYLFYKLNDSTLARYNVATAVQDVVQIKEANYLVALNEDSVWVRRGIGNSVLVSFKTKTTGPVTSEQFTDSFADNHFFITGGFAVKTGGFIAVVNNKGYYRYNSAKKTFTKINLFYAGKPVAGIPVVSNNTLYREENGTAWLANEEGFVYFNPLVQNIGLLRSNTTAGQQQWDDEIRNLTEDDKGNIWFGTADGFCKWDKASGNVTTWKPNFATENYLNYPSIKGLGYSNGKIIIGQSEKGFWIYDPVKQTFQRPVFKADSLQRKFQKGFNANMLKLRNGNFLILSGSVWLMDKGTFITTLVEKDETFTAGRAAYEDAQGRIWLVGRNGISATDSNFEMLYSLPDRILGRWCNAIVQKDDSTFWVAAKTLYEIKLRPQKQLAIRPIFPELKNVHLSGLFKDSLGNIWMCSNDGIYRFVASKIILEKFDRGDNAYNFEESVSSSFRSSNGIVYFGSMSGINYFTPEKIPLQDEPLQVQLLNVSVNRDDSSYILQGSLPRLRYNQNELAFDFIAPYLHNAEKVQYRYKMEGVDKDWINLGNASTVHFTSLRPGKYVFTAAASLNGKDWYPIQKPLSFVIKPPFWQTWWFRVLMLFAGIGAVYLFVKRRERSAAEKEAQKTEIEKLKAASYQSQFETEQVINYFATFINTMKTVDELLWDVSKNLIGQLGFEDSMIYLWNGDKTVLIQKAGYGIKGSMQSEIHKELYNVPKGKGIVGASVELKQTVLVNDTATDTRYFSVDGKIRLSELCVPIMHDNETMGAINTEHSIKNFYTGRHVQILTTIASLCGAKIDEIITEQESRAKEVEVITLQKDLATSQLTTLRAQMNPHFIFNSLNSIAQLVASKQNEEGLQYLSKFSKLLRLVLDESENSFICLKDEIRILDLYLQLETLRFGSSFSYTIHADEELDEEETLLPTFLIHPVIENAIWHGLLHKKGERRLIINFQKKGNDKLVCIVKDNGIGIEAATVKKQQQLNGEKRNSKGLKMVKERLALLSEQKNTGTDFSIEDMKDENGYISGTKCTLELPVIYE